MTYWGSVLMPVHPSLAFALAEGLIDVLRFIEGCDDEQMNPDDAVKVLEGVGHLVGMLSSGQRSEFVDLLATMAEAESDPARRKFLEGFPEGFGLLDDAA
ncbi:hypothetical protein [Kitasatospora paranensis]|uniref:Uncharacterized protein n=1 Tax=Kitasatospora paranensis TaxID=258053 RepID=A0ABW2FYP2_9ACTN